MSGPAIMAAKSDKYGDDFTRQNVAIPLWIFVREKLCGEMPRYANTDDKARDRPAPGPATAGSASASRETFHRFSPIMTDSGTARFTSVLSGCKSSAPTNRPAIANHLVVQTASV